MLRAIPFVLVGLIWSWGTLMAQDPHFIHFTPQDGLPSAETYDVEVDERGVVWICTDRGVCSFNGYEFTRYTTREGLSNNSVLEGPKTRDGKLWFVTLDGSANWLTDKGPEPFPGNQALVEQAGKDQLIFKIIPGEDGEYYFFYRGKNSPFCVRVDTSMNTAQRLSYTELTRLYPSGRIHDFEYIQINNELFPTTRPIEFLELNKLDVYYARFATRNRLVRGQIDRPDFRQEYDLTGAIMDLATDHMGDLWASTTDGLFRFPAGDLSRTPDHFFDGLAVSSISEDLEHNYWITSLDQGIFYIPSFETCPVDLQSITERNFTPTAIVHSDQHLIVGTLGGELLSIDQNFQAERLHSDPEMFGLLNFGISHPSEPYLNRFKLQEGPNGLSFEEVIPDSFLPILLPLYNGAALSAGHSGFLMVDPLSKLPLAQPPAKFRVRILCALEQGEQIYLGTQHGVLVVDQYDFEHPRKLLPDEPLLDIRVNDILADEFGNLWFGTVGNGVLRVRGEKVETVYQPAGVYGNMINALTLGDGSKLWIASNEGVFWLDYAPGAELVVEDAGNWDYKDGLPSNFIRDIAWWKEKVWVGTDQGLVYVDPGKMDPTTTTPPMVYLEWVKAEDSLRLPTEPVELAPDENNIALRFVGITNHKPSREPFYRFRLLGLDSSWTTSNDRTAQYLNLRSGDYTFEVSARRKGGDWNPEPTRYSFSVRPQIINNFYFALLVGGTVLLAIIALIVIRNRRRRELRS